MEKEQTANREYRVSGLLQNEQDVQNIKSDIAALYKSLSCLQSALMLFQKEWTESDPDINKYSLELFGGILLCSGAISRYEDILYSHLGIKTNKERNEEIAKEMREKTSQNNRGEEISNNGSSESLNVSLRNHRVIGLSESDAFLVSYTLIGIMTHQYREIEGSFEQAKRAMKARGFGDLSREYFNDVILKLRKYLAISGITNKYIYQTHSTYYPVMSIEDLLKFVRQDES